MYAYLMKFIKIANEKKKNINKKPIYFENFSKQNRNFLSQLYDGSANSKNLTQCKNDFD